jgi:Ras-related protein Rab-23
MLQEMDMEFSLKVIAVGNGRVGKTSMITRFAKGVMTDNYKKTIGTDFMEKEINIRESGEAVRLMLWDTAGQEMFSKLTRNYYKGSGAVIYVFSTTDRDSFLEVENWQSKVKEECGDIVSVLVQNKIDLLDKAEVTSAEVEGLAQRMGVKLYRTCVKDNILVDDVFDYVADMFVKQGGEAGLGVESVPTIGSIANKRENSNTTQQRAPQQQSAAGGFTLTPSTRRTGGKKRTFCAIL